jgi:hypothetical protein
MSMPPHHKATLSLFLLILFLLHYLLSPLAILAQTGSDSAEVIINEVMYKPLTGQSEWVELYNRSSDLIISLDGWRLSDANTAQTAEISNTSLSPGEFLIIAQDSTVFWMNLPLSALVIIPNYWPLLNNDGDHIFIFNSAGNIVESLNYPDNWGDVDNGVSMEKSDPLSPSSDLSNWFPSVSASGGTPGERNSVYFLPSPGQKAELSVTPEIFFPELGGANACVSIHFKLPYPFARVNLRIFDVRGRCIRVLADGISFGSEGTISWDGKDEHNKIARLGIYIIHLQALNETFAGSVEVKTTVILGKKL